MMISQGFVHRRPQDVQSPEDFTDEFTWRSSKASTTMAITLPDLISLIHLRVLCFLYCLLFSCRRR